MRNKTERSKSEISKSAIARSAFFRYFILPHFILVPGCTTYTRSEIDLAEQARKGLTLVRLAQADHVALAGRMNEAQRKRLDDAFDADVRETADLSPEWVVDHRKAYATGIDALAVQHNASSLAAQTAARNVEAIDAALAQLQRLQKARLKLETTLTTKPEDK
jgi:hypothetical protein